MADPKVAIVPEVVLGPDGKPVPAEYLGSKTYKLTQPHDRQGKMFQPGDSITVVNETPGKTWVPVKAEKSKAELKKAN